MIHRAATAGLAVTLLAGGLAPAHAAPAITCHCFTDRSFDAAKPAAADPYFLATTANSFLAVSCAIDKRSIVLKKQRGVSSDDLWVAAWVATKTGASSDRLLQAKSEKETWQAALAAEGLAARIPAPVSGLVARGAAPAALAQAAVDDLLLRYRLVPAADLATMRKAWGTNQEVILATLLGLKTRQPAPQVLATAKSGGKTWGQLLSAARIESGQIMKEWEVLLKGR